MLQAIDYNASDGGSVRYAASDVQVFRIVWSTSISLMSNSGEML